VPALSEQGHEEHPSQAAALIVDLLQWPGDSLVCTHRPALPTLVDALTQHARRSVAEALPRSDPFLHPGEALVAHIAQTAKGPRVVAFETHRSPLHVR
jgi:8-oxo-(d)GTP phosphatase